MAKKYGKIDFESVLIAAAAGATYTAVTNAVSKSKTNFSAKWNKNKDEYYTAGAAAAGFGLLYFIPGKKWATAAGYGLIGASGAIATQVIGKKLNEGKDDTGDTGSEENKMLNGYRMKKMLNRASATRPATALLSRGTKKPNRVNPNNYAAITNCDILGLN
jgi:hypothetical protein